MNKDKNLMVRKNELEKLLKSKQKIKYSQLLAVISTSTIIIEINKCILA